MDVESPPFLEGVEHRFVDVGGGITIHVADAGPDDGPPVMLVHGYPQNWWAWRDLIGPLAAEGYRVLCPDLRGAGWSSAPRDRYYKTAMADDLAAVLDRLGVVGPVRLVAHDWGGPVAIIMILRHPAKVSAFFGLNTAGPWLTPGLALLRHLWRFGYQIPMAIPVLGPRLIGDPKGRYNRWMAAWGGAGFVPPDIDAYLSRLTQPSRAVAGSRWYRTFHSREAIRWLRGEFANDHLTIPVRFLLGVNDPVFTPALFRHYPKQASDFRLDTVDGIGHWIVEQQPDLVRERLSAFLRETSGA